MPTFTTTIEVEVEVEYSVDGENRPAVTHGQADNWSPAEFAEIELDKVTMSLLTHTGKRTLNLLPVLDSDTQQILMDEAAGRAESDEADAYAEAMERKADAARDDLRLEGRD